MSLINELKSRNLFHSCTDEKKLSETLEKEKITLYLGFDLTAKSLHVGNLTGIMALRLFQKYSHHVIILLGDGTTKIGDPSGKDEMRKMISYEEIEENRKNILACIGQFLDLEKCTVVQNSTWLDKLNYIEMLRDIGAYFSVNNMLTMESVKARLERQQHLSFIEFNYMILQGYDFWYLNKHHNCHLQVGGSDQWGNILQGFDLICKKEKNHNAFGLTWPLLTTSDGKKMGKSVNGAVWLKPDMLSDFDYFQYFRNVDDADLKRMMKVFTDISVEEVEKIDMNNHIEINKAKELLAFEATKICRGLTKAEEVLRNVKDLFENKNTDNVKEFTTKKDINIVDLIVEIGICESKSSARKLIEQGGIKIDGTAVNVGFTVSHECILSKGKKEFFKIIVS